MRLKMRGIAGYSGECFSLYAREKKILKGKE